jgi:hypothetical protein
MSTILRRLFACLLSASAILGVVVCNDAEAKSSKRGSKYRNSAFLVPPPPPTAVSPLVLASYPSGMGGMQQQLRFIPSKPRKTSETMRLTCVMDDTAFFKINADEAVAMKEGMSYQNVKLAQISPDSVILVEKGKQITMHLR